MDVRYPVFEVPEEFPVALLLLWSEFVEPRCKCSPAVVIKEMFLSFETSVQP